MKVFHYLPKNIGSFAIFSILLTACVNHISEENEAIIADGNIPLKFVTDIHELTNTRIVGNSFEEGEGVGLFALAGSTTMQEERYVDNLHFVRSSGGEFLSDELVYQAIVAYPMKNDATADLSQGVVVQLLGQSGKVHGGKVSWNIDEHSLTYIAGTLPVYNNIYVLANGKVTLSITEADDVLQVLALDDVARDVRGGVIHNYPLVKIGTQYWMRNNLEAALFANGDEIPKLNEVTENAVGYLLSCTNNYLYTASVALSPDFLPLHWNIPNWEDWNILNSYLKGDVSLLKSGEWVSIDGAEVLPVNNDSGFNGLPVGMYSYPDLSVLEGKFLGYWTLDDTNTEMAESVFFLKSNANTMETATSAVERKAFSIRCIRK